MSPTAARAADGVAAAQPATASASAQTSSSGLATGRPTNACHFLEL
jgi:hypothetical protein